MSLPGVWLHEPEFQAAASTLRAARHKAGGYLRAAGEPERYLRAAGPVRQPDSVDPPQQD